MGYQPKALPSKDQLAKRGEGIIDAIQRWQGVNIPILSAMRIDALADQLDEISDEIERPPQHPPCRSSMPTAHLLSQAGVSVEQLHKALNTFGRAALPPPQLIEYRPVPHVHFESDRYAIHDPSAGGGWAGRELRSHATGELLAVYHPESHAVVRVSPPNGVHCGRCGQLFANPFAANPANHSCNPSQMRGT